MTKEKLDALLKGMDGLGLGADDGKPHSAARGDAALMSAISVLSILPLIQSSPVSWDGSKATSRMYLIGSRIWDARGATEMPSSCLNLWITFETLLPIAK